VQEPKAKFDHNSKKNMRDKVKAKLKQEGIVAVNYGVVGIPKEEAEARKIFEFAKDMGLYGITTESDGSIDTIEKMVKEFDIRVGYHEHARQPNNPSYKVWDPKYIAGLVKDRDPRIGACADTGHWQRSGLKPVECLKILEGRIISVHLKDLNQFGEVKAHDVHWGKGKGDVPGVLAELKRQGLKGNVSVEYEYNWKNNVEDATDCIQYVRNWKP
jgi:sugar phosphate isomerase/epimerase